MDGEERLSCVRQLCRRVWPTEPEGEPGASAIAALPKGDTMAAACYAAVQYAEKSSEEQAGKMSIADDMMKLGLAYTQTTLAASEVITRRVNRMTTGTMSAPEALGMVSEKALAFARSGERAAAEVAKGANPVAIATAALRPIRATTRSNVRKLRR